MAKQRRPKVPSEDPQLAVLRAIFEEMKLLNARVERTNERLDAVRTDVTDELDHLRRRVVESEVRLATATTQLSGDVQTLSGLIREWREEHRSDRAEMKDRVARLEQHVGIGPSR
jgi:uncharacterized protein YlxW (UPF0749 family)